MNMNNTMKFSLFGISFFSSAFLILCLFVSEALVAKERFSPPDLNSALDNFEKRFGSDTTNIDFIVAQVLNNARQIERAGEEFKSNAQIFSNNNFGRADNTAASNSVIIPPGTKADTIIVINQNDGDSYAISR